MLKDEFDCLLNADVTDLGGNGRKCGILGGRAIPADPVEKQAQE